MNELENQIKEFLLEVCNKYKNISDDDNLGIYAYLMINEYENFLIPKIDGIDLLSSETIYNLTNYAVELSKDFKNRYIGRAFWYNFGYVLRY